MQLRNTEHRYGWVSRVLHWTSVVLVLVIYIDIIGLDVPPKLAMRDAVVDRHALLGTVLLALMCMRFLWRQGNPNPVHGYALPPWNRVLAMAVHRSLYVLVISLCVLGLIGYDRAETALSTTALDVHDTLAGLLLVVVAGHAVAGVYNQALGLVAAPPEGEGQ